jgi:hypothetical protein
VNLVAFLTSCGCDLQENYDFSLRHPHFPSPQSLLGQKVKIKNQY